MSAPGSRLRLLHVITDLGIGGAEVVLVRLVGRWQAAGHDNLVVSLLPGGELALASRQQARASSSSG